MTYLNFEVSIATNAGLKFLEVTACDITSAHADIVETYGADVEIVSTRLL